MRVGVIVDHPFEAPLGYSIRPRELSMNLAELGCKVYVFSPVDVSRRFSNNLILYGGSSGKIYFMKIFHGLLRKAYKSSLFARYLFRREVLEFLAKRLADSLYSKVKNCNLDVLQGEKEIAAMAAIYISKRLGIPVVSDIHGLLAEEAVQYGFIKDRSEEYLKIRKFVSDVLYNSNAIIVVSESLKDYFVENLNCNNKNFFTIPNAGIFRGIVRPFRPMPCNIVYAGIIEPWERVNLVIESMSYVVKVNRKAKLLIAGAGSLKNDLVKLVKRLKLSDCVSFVGLIPYDKISNFLVQGDVAVLPSTKDVVRKVACPIKLFDYLAAGLPVVTVDGLWWSNFVKIHDVGVAVKDEPKSFADAINDLLSNPDKIDAMGKNAVNLIQYQYNWRNMAKKLLKVYEKII